MLELSTVEYFDKGPPVRGSRIWCHHNTAAVTFDSDKSLYIAGAKSADRRTWMEPAPPHSSSNGSAKGAARKGLNTTVAASSAESPITSPASATSPPYWVQSHQRSVSNISVESIPHGAITLQDNTVEGGDGKNKACWAKSVYIEDFVIVNGSRTGIGAFVVYNISVETLNGGSMRIRKRYSEFDELRDRLLQTFPYSEGALPPLPPKSVVSKFRPNFLEKRRSGLQYFLNCILLNPEFAGSPVLKDFLFS